MRQSRRFSGSASRRPGAGPRPGRKRGYRTDLPDGAFLIDQPSATKDEAKWSSNSGWLGRVAAEAEVIDG
jgi:hypothetical protein